MEGRYHFHSAGWWAELWKQSTRAAVRDAFSLRSHKAAWEDWLQCDNPYAQRDAGMMEKAGWRYFDSIGIIATVSPAACSNRTSYYKVEVSLEGLSPVRRNGLPLGSPTLEIPFAEPPYLR